MSQADCFRSGIYYVQHIAINDKRKRKCVTLDINKSSGRGDRRASAGTAHGTSRRAETVAPSRVEIQARPRRALVKTPLSPASSRRQVS